MLAEFLPIPYVKALHMYALDHKVHCSQLEALRGNYDVYTHVKPTGLAARPPARPPALSRNAVLFSCTITLRHCHPVLLRLTPTPVLPQLTTLFLIDSTSSEAPPVHLQPRTKLHMLHVTPLPNSYPRPPEILPQSLPVASGAVRCAIWTKRSARTAALWLAPPHQQCGCSRSSAITRLAVSGWMQLQGLRVCQLSKAAGAAG